MREIVRQAEVVRRNLPAPAPADEFRIVGGDDVPPGRFPSCCCIGGASSWFCTGVVVAPQVVLTAAHCGAAITRVMVGGERVLPALGPGARIVAVRCASLFTLNTGRILPMSTTSTCWCSMLLPAWHPRPLALVDHLRSASEVELVGFGYNDPNLPNGFGIKRQVRGPLLPMKLTPNDDLGDLPAELGFHADYEFVAGRKGLGLDTCNGDSGGPAYISSEGQFFLAGLTSGATRTANVNCGDGGIMFVRSPFSNGFETLPARQGWRCFSNRPSLLATWIARAHPFVAVHKKLNLI